MKRFTYVVVLLVALTAILVESKTCKKKSVARFTRCLQEGFQSTIESCQGFANKTALEGSMLKRCRNVEKELTACGFECEPKPEPEPKHCKTIRSEYAEIEVINDQTLQLTWVDDRPNAAGEINWDDTTRTGTGYVTFPDDKRYELKYYPEEGTIYWDGDKGTTNIIWQDAICGLTPKPKLKYCKTIRSEYAEIEVINDQTLQLTWVDDRPNAAGEINWDDTTRSGTGYVTFPDDKRYELKYYPELGTIYWDGDRGTTNIIWQDAICEA